MEKVMNQFVVDAATNCWNWAGYVSKDGYGQINRNSKVVRTHRFVYTHLVGKIPEGKLVCHKCDNRKCLNPDHLFLGTVADNNKDRDLKGRNAKHHPGRRASQILTDDQITEVMQLARTGKHTQLEIAQKYGMARTSLGQLIKRQTNLGT